MKVDFWKPTTPMGIIKATIHKSGKLGFSQAAIKKLQINENSFIMIGTNKDNKSDEAIYLMVTNKPSEMSLKVNKAGQYYYLNTKDFFNENKIDFYKNKIMYDIIDISENNEKLYRLIPREIERKKRNK